MTACQIRYRLDSPGPATLLVECDGELRVYTRGQLGGAASRSQVLASLAARGVRWTPTSGEIELDLEAENRALRRAEAAMRPLDPAAIPVPTADMGDASA